MRNNPLTYELIIPRRRTQFSGQGGCATLAACSSIGSRLGWSSQSPTLAWAANWTPDEVLASTLLYPNSALVGGLISQSGKAATAVAIVATATSSSPQFDPRSVYVALLRDIDGTDYESPPNPDLGPEYGSRPMVGARPEYGSGFQVYRTLIAAPASWTPGFRVWLAASAGLNAAVTISVSFKQA